MQAELARVLRGWAQQGSVVVDLAQHGVLSRQLGSVFERIGTTDQAFHEALRRACESAARDARERVFRSLGLRLHPGAGSSFAGSSPQGGRELRVALGLALARGDSQGAVLRTLARRGAQEPGANAAAAQVVRAWRSRTERIATTEVYRAHNQATAEAIAQAAQQIPGLRKTWDATEDKRLCPRCAALDGVTVGALEDFPGAGKCPPLHPNCRCVVVASDERLTLPAFHRFDVTALDDALEREDFGASLQLPADAQAEVRAQLRELGLI